MNEYFLEAYGKAATPEEILARTDYWHEMDDDLWDMLGQPEIHEVLGWTLEEYGSWLLTEVIPK